MKEAKAEQKVWLCVDPGETTGFSIWKGGKLIWADQLPMWKFVDAVFLWAQTNIIPEELICADGFKLNHTLHAIVCEDWKLYPWVIHAGGLDFDSCRTARAIGGLTLICRQFGVQLILQGADIKQGAKAAGAESLYIEPVDENRHANDSIQHGVFYTAVHGCAP